MAEETFDLNKITAQAIRDYGQAELERILQEKLDSAGVQVRPASIRRVAKKILAGAKGHISFREKSVKDVDIEFTQSDFDELIKRTEKFGIEELPRILIDVADISANEIFDELEKSWGKELRLQRADMKGFQKRLEHRYGIGLNKLRILVHIATEHGEKTYKRKWSEGRGRLSNLDDVLIRLHVRGCQVTQEIVTLLENGLADGAMARWRTLHEITTVAFFIEKHGEEIAKRYVEFQIVESKRALNVYNETYRALKNKPYPKRQAAKITTDYAKVIAKYGEPFGGEYGWAADLIGEGPKKRVTIATLERAAGLEVMRAHYRMASYNVHANPKGVYFKLGQLETTSVLLAGRSNAGLVEPAQNAALSLAKLTVAACGDHQPAPLDYLIFSKVISRLSKEIPADFAEADRLLQRDHFELTKIAKKLVRRKRSRKK